MLARHFHGLVRDHPDFEVLEEPAGSQYRFRYMPHRFCERRNEPGMPARLDRLNRDIAEAAQRLGILPVTATEFASGVALRISTEQPNTREADVDAAFEAIARIGQLLLQKEAL